MQANTEETKALCYTCNFAVCCISDVILSAIHCWLAVAILGNHFDGHFQYLVVPVICVLHFQCANC